MLLATQLRKSPIDGTPSLVHAQVVGEDDNDEAWVVGRGSGLEEEETRKNNWGPKNA